jgi:hypothetical protein
MGLAVLLSSCEPRHKKPHPGEGLSGKALIEHENRFTDFRKSHLFDQKVSALAAEIGRWNEQFVHAVENQGSGERLPLVFNPIDMLTPVLKESKRGFFHKSGNVWSKEVSSTEKLSVEKEITLERLSVVLTETKSRHFHERESSWVIHVYGNYGKDLSDEILVLRWNGLSRFLEVENKMYIKYRFQCQYKFDESGAIKRAHCTELVLYRSSNKDILVEQMDFEDKKGFSGVGRIFSAKALTDKDAQKNHDKASEKLTDKSNDKPTDKSAEKSTDKTNEKPADKWTLTRIN